MASANHLVILTLAVQSPGRLPALLLEPSILSLCHLQKGRLPAGHLSFRLSQLGGSCPLTVDVDMCSVFRKEEGPRRCRPSGWPLGTPGKAY